MHISNALLESKHGKKEPIIKGLNVGDFFLFCGHCGWQGKPNYVSNPWCPDCRKPMLECRVTQSDADEGRL